MSVSELQVRAGAIIALRLFDVAYAIDLREVEALWSRQPRAAPRRSQLATTPAKAVAFDVPPVLLALDAVELELDGVRVTATATARLYDFGAVALALRIPVGGVSWPEFTRGYNTVDRVVSAPDAAFWHERLLRPLLATLAPALLRPSPSRLQEDYLIALVQQWSEPVRATELEQHVDLVSLLSGERRPLSEGARRDLLRHRFSYYEDDLAIITWDRAFICEPRGDSDVADVLEVANAQLLELRYYDELLDDELPLMYDRVEHARRTLNLLAPRRFARLAHRLYTLVAEVTELTERVDNALQVTEDVYLARIYAAALELFRVKSVSAAVDRKLAIIRDTYAALYEEATGAQAALMELTIVLLIVLEIVLALMHRG
jgi:hypothetical protein